MQGSLAMPLLLASGIIACLISDVLLQSSNGINVALNKTVYAEAQWKWCLVDGKFDTTISPYDSTFPAFIVDLQDVYNLSSVHVHAQNEWSFYDFGLNVSFSVYVWDKPTCRCDFERYYPWKPVGTNLVFRSKGEEIVLRGPFVAQYIIIMPDFADYHDVRRVRSGLTMGELRAFGTKIREGYKLLTPKDGPFRPTPMELRDQLLEGQGPIYTEFGRTNLRQHPEQYDIALTWIGNRIGMMLSRRFRGRIISIIGMRTMEKLFSDPDHDPLLQNLRRWLSHKYEKATFVNVTGNYSSGDILIITPIHKFDVEEVYKNVINGINSAILVCSNIHGQPGASLPELLRKLRIRVKYNDDNEEPREVYGNWFLNNTRDNPDDADLRVVLHRWSEFSSRRLNFGHLPEHVLESARFQGSLYDVLKKYQNFFDHHAPCRLTPYDKNPETDIALQNYNDLLLLQRGSHILPAPGAWNAPGGVSPNATRSNFTVHLKIDVAGQYFPTGAYAAPGEAVEYKVLDFTGGNIEDFQIQVNPQTDDVFNRETMIRWPRVWLRQPLKMKGYIGSAFGGPIVISAPASSSLLIQFKNVYRYAFFNIRDRNAMENWESEKQNHAGTPYGMIMGDNMISMLETPALLRMNASTIEWATRYYDNVVKMIHNYRGTKHEHQRLEVFVTDEQISREPAHEGYPWMARRDWSDAYDAITDILNGSRIAYPSEIGRNLQVFKLTLKNGKDVMNHVYVPVVHKYLLNISSYSKGHYPGWSAADERNLIDTWNSTEYQGVQVSYYNYLGRLFSPALVANVFSLGMHTKKNLTTEQRKIDFWIQHLCTESGYDLVPFHRLWHFPISQCTAEICSEYECVFPNDELTAQVPDLVNTILQDYGKKCFRGKPRRVEYRRNIMHGIDQIKPQSIFITDN